MIENLISFFRTRFRKNGTEFTNSNKQTKCPEIDDSFLSLLGDHEKLYYQQNSKGLITNTKTTITLSILPTIYLLTSVLTILVLLMLNNRSRYQQHMISISSIPDYYDLSKVNPAIFHIYTCITSICGVAIVFILFSVLKQRFKVPEYRDHTFKLYIMALFGVISNALNFLKGFSPYLKNNEVLKEFGASIKLEITHLIFLALILFSIMFSLYSVTIMNLLRTKNKNSNSRHRNEEEDNWYNYKIVILCYLCTFTLIYLIFLLHNNHMLGGLESKLKIKEFMDRNSVFVLEMFPYFLHIINAVLMFSFYFELKYVNMALSQNLEVDYLFNDENQNKENTDEGKDLKSNVI